MPNAKFMPQTKFENLFDAVNHILHDKNIQLDTATRKELEACLAKGHETPTVAARWREAGENDPHGKRYDCERHELPHGSLTDDEFANSFFLQDHRTGLQSMSWLQSAKDRIRWLSRKLVKAEKEIEILNAKLSIKKTDEEQTEREQRVRSANLTEWKDGPFEQLFILPNGRVYLVTNTGKPYVAGEYPSGGFVIERAVDVKATIVRSRDDVIWGYVVNSPDEDAYTGFLNAVGRGK